MRIPFTDLVIIRAATIAEKGTAIRGLAAIVLRAHRILSPFALCGWCSKRAGREEIPDNHQAALVAGVPLYMEDFRQAEVLQGEIHKLRKEGQCPTP